MTNQSRIAAIWIVAGVALGLMAASDSPRTWESWQEDFDRLYSEVLKVDQTFQQSRRNSSSDPQDLEALPTDLRERLGKLKSLAAKGNEQAWVRYREEAFEGIRKSLADLAGDPKTPVLERAEKVATILRGAIANPEMPLEKISHFFLDEGNEILSDLLDQAAAKVYADVKRLQSEISQLQSAESKAKTGGGAGQVEPIQKEIAAKQRALRSLLGSESGQADTIAGSVGRIDFRGGDLAWYLDNLRTTEARVDGPLTESDRYRRDFFDGGDQSEIAAKVLSASESSTDDARVDFLSALMGGDDVRGTRVADALRQKLWGQRLQKDSNDPTPAGEEVRKAAFLQRALTQLSEIQSGKIEKNFEVLDFLQKFKGDPQGENLLGLTYAELLKSMARSDKPGNYGDALKALETAMQEARHLPLNEVLSAIRSPMAAVNISDLDKDQDCRNRSSDEALKCRRAEMAKRAAIRLGVIAADISCNQADSVKRADCLQAKAQHEKNAKVLRDVPSFGGIEDFLHSRYTCAALEKARTDDQVIALGPVRGQCHVAPETYRGSLDDARRYLTTGIPEVTGVEGQVAEMLKSAREIFRSQAPGSQVKKNDLQEEYLEGIRHTFMTQQAERLATLSLLQDGGTFDAAEIEKLCPKPSSNGQTSLERAVARHQAQFQKDLEAIEGNLSASQITGNLPSGPGNGPGAEAAEFRLRQSVDLILAAYSMEILEREREIRNEGRGPKWMYSSEMIQWGSRHPYLTLEKDGKSLYRRLTAEVDQALGIERTEWVQKDGRDRQNTLVTSQGSPHPFLTQTSAAGVDDGSRVRERLMALLKDPKTGPTLSAVVQSAISEGIAAAKSNIKTACEAPLREAAKGSAPFAIEEIRDPGLQARFFDRIENRMYLEHECSLRENKTVLKFLGSEGAAQVATPVAHMLLWISGHGATSIAWSLGASGSKALGAQSKLERGEALAGLTGSGGFEGLNTLGTEAQGAWTEFGSAVASEAFGMGLGFKGNIRQLAPFLRNYGFVPGMAEGGRRMASDAVRRRALQTTIDKATGAVRVPIFVSQNGSGVAMRILGDEVRLVMDHGFIRDPKAVKSFLKQFDEMIAAAWRIENPAKRALMVENLTKMKRLVDRRGNLWERFVTRLKGGPDPSSRTFVPRFEEKAFHNLSEEARNAVQNIFTSVDDPVMEGFLKQYQDEVLNVIQAIDGPGATLPDGLIMRLANEIRASATVSGITRGSLDDLGKALRRIVTECSRSAASAK